MRLLELDAQFMRCTDDRTRERVATLEQAHGVLFQCPKCAQGKPTGEEEGRKHVVGAHYVYVWFEGRNVPSEAKPAPRWGVKGSCLADLSISPSIQIIGACGWHGYVTNGEASIL